MNKPLIFFFLVFFLCIVTGHSNTQPSKATLILQDGTEFQVPDAGSIFIVYQTEDTRSFTFHTNISHKIHYFFEENKIETNRVVELS